MNTDLCSLCNSTVFINTLILTNALSVQPALGLAGASGCCTGACPPLEEEEGWGGCTGSEERLGDHLWHDWPGLGWQAVGGVGCGGSWWIRKAQGSTTLNQLHHRPSLGVGCALSKVFLCGS